MSYSRHECSGRGCGWLGSCDDLVPSGRSVKLSAGSVRLSMSVGSVKVSAGSVKVSAGSVRLSAGSVSRKCQCQ